MSSLREWIEMARWMVGPGAALAVGRALAVVAGLFAATMFELRPVAGIMGPSRAAAQETIRLGRSDLMRRIVPS